MCPLEENPIILSSGGMALGNLPPTASKFLLKKKLHQVHWLPHSI